MFLEEENYFPAHGMRYLSAAHPASERLHHVLRTWLDACIQDRRPSLPWSRARALLVPSNPHHS